MKKEEVLKKLVHDLERFLGEHKNLEFYALALDCNAEYATFLVCMNTPDDFGRTLKRYQERYKEYTDEKKIKKLRYNPGDWEYTGISEITLFEEEELTNTYQDDIDTQCSEIMAICLEILHDFQQTEIFTCIPKTPDFISFCIDHDEDVEEALEREKY